MMLCLSQDPKEARLLPMVWKGILALRLLQEPIFS
jgi:hypothetical protein